MEEEAKPRPMYLATTRFTAETLAENRAYLQAIRVEEGPQSTTKCIYGVDRRISLAACFGNAKVYVLEMNNTLNRIEGLGVVRNAVDADRRHPMYSKPEYNRYVYRGDEWYSRDQLLCVVPEMVPTLERVLFTGRSHVKRLSGISVVGQKLLDNWRISAPNLRSHVAFAIITARKSAPGTSANAASDELERSCFGCDQVHDR